MKPTTVSVLVALAALLLGGCDSIGVPRLTNSYISSSFVRNTYSYSLLMRATTGRALPVRVIGQPFPAMPQVEFAKAVVADMPTGFLNRGSYMLDPGGIAGIGFRVVWNFDPDPRGSPEDLCLSRSSGFTRPGPAAPGGVMHIQAAVALCQEDGAYVANYGGIDVASTNDPTFADFINKMTLSTLISPPTESTGGLGWRF